MNLNSPPNEGHLIGPSAFSGFALNILCNLQDWGYCMDAVMMFVRVCTECHKEVHSGTIGFHQDEWGSWLLDFLWGETASRRVRCSGYNIWKMRFFRIELLFKSWDYFAQCKVARSNKTLISHLAEWTQNPRQMATWRTGPGRDRICEHFSGIFSIQIWSPGGVCCGGIRPAVARVPSDTQTTLDTGRINTGSCCIKCVLKATLRLRVMIDCEKSKTRHRNQQPVGENKCNWQSKSTKSTAGPRWQPSFDGEEIFLVSGELGSVKVWWDGRGWKDGGIFKPTHSRQMSNPVRCLRWLVFKNTAVSAAQIFPLLR